MPLTLHKCKFCKMPKDTVKMSFKAQFCPVLEISKLPKKLSLRMVGILASFPSGDIFSCQVGVSNCPSMVMHAHMGIYGTEGRLDFALLTVRST